MKNRKLIGLLAVAAMALSFTACDYVYDYNLPTPSATEWVVPGSLDLATRTVTVGTNNEAGRPVNSRDQYDFTGFLDIVMTYTFNANGTLASFVVVQDGHGVDLAGGASSCSRWNPESANENDVIPFLNRLIADGVVFPNADVDTSARATYSKNGVLLTLNYAAGQFQFD